MMFASINLFSKKPSLINQSPHALHTNHRNQSQPAPLKARASGVNEAGKEVVSSKERKLYGVRAEIRAGGVAPS